jgi:hypothetical protein
MYLHRVHNMLILQISCTHLQQKFNNMKLIHNRATVIWKTLNQLSNQIQKSSCIMGKVYE